MTIKEDKENLSCKERLNDRFLIKLDRHMHKTICNLPKCILKTINGIIFRGGSSCSSTAHAIVFRLAHTD